MRETEAAAKLESTYRSQSRMMAGQLRPTLAPADQLDPTPEAMLVALRRIAEIARVPSLLGWFAGLGRRLGGGYAKGAAIDYSKADRVG